MFDFRHTRRVLDAGGDYREFEVVDYAYARWQLETRQANGPLPASFVNALQLAPSDHLAMQAALQPYVDSAISKTINVPSDYPFEQFEDLYRVAYRFGLKGCTTFRPNPVTGEVLTSQGPDADCSHCCGLEREDD